MCVASVLSRAGGYTLHGQPGSGGRGGGTPTPTKQNRQSTKAKHKPTINMQPIAIPPRISFKLSASISFLWLGGSLVRRTSGGSYSSSGGNISSHIAGVVPDMMNSRRSASRKGSASWIRVPLSHAFIPRINSLRLTRPNGMSVFRRECQA